MTFPVPGIRSWFLVKNDNLALSAEGEVYLRLASNAQFETRFNSPAYTILMYTYKIDVVQKVSFQSLESILEEAEARLNHWAAAGWELDHLMPIEAGGYSNGAILVLRSKD